MKKWSLCLFCLLVAGPAFGLPPDWKEQIEAASDKAMRQAWVEVQAHHKQATPEAVRGHTKTKTMNELKLGDYVRSTVSSFTGTLTAKCEYLYGVPQGQVTLTVPVNGETKSEWFALSELEVVR